MKPLPLTLVMIAAAVVSWWLFAPEDEIPPADDPAAVREREEADETPKVDPPPEPADEAGSGKSSAPAQAPKPPPKPPVKPKKWVVPLSDKFIRASWADEGATVVLEHIAQAAGKRLRMDSTARRKLAQVRVTMDQGRTALPVLLDKILKIHTLGWNVRGDVLEVFDDDD